MMFNTNRNKQLCNEKSIATYGYNYKQRNKSSLAQQSLLYYLICQRLIVLQPIFATKIVDKRDI